MTPIRYTVGDATQPNTSGPAIIAHICNDMGGWGKGFVLAISRRWKEPERQYRKWFRASGAVTFALGKVQMVMVGPDLHVCNMVAQHDIVIRDGLPPIRYEALAECLSTLADMALAMNASVHRPRIGCGLAGGTWDRIEPLLLDRLSARELSVTVYDVP